MGKLTSEEASALGRKGAAAKRAKTLLEKSEGSLKRRKKLEDAAWWCATRLKFWKRRCAA